MDLSELAGALQTPKLEHCVGLADDPADRGQPLDCRGYREGPEGQQCHVDSRRGEQIAVTDLRHPETMRWRAGS